MHHLQLPHVTAPATLSFVVMHHFHSVYNGRIQGKMCEDSMIYLEITSFQNRYIELSKAEKYKLVDKS